MPAGETWTVRRILQWTFGYFERKAVDSPRLSAELLLSHVLGVPRIRLFMDHDRPLIDAELSRFRELVRRAGEHEPIAYLIGKAGFFNLELDVGPGVLIPRPETETLVEHVLQAARHDPAMLERPRVLDLCTGSGAIALAVAKGLKTASVIAIDISPVAVGIAKKNADKLGLADRVQVEQGDLYEPLSRIVDASPFHLLLSNPPYIPTAQIAELDRNVRDYEPREALDGGLDGLEVHRRILAQAASRLLPGGRVYLEIGYDQGKAGLELLAAHPELSEPRVLRDLGGRDRVLTAVRS